MTERSSVSGDIERIVAQARERYPDLKLSFGYIGNVEFQRDDRAWTVWANAVPGFAHGNAANLGLRRTYELDAMLRHLQSPSFESWLVAMSQRLRDLGPRAASRRPSRGL